MPVSILIICQAQSAHEGDRIHLLSVPSVRVRLHLVYMYTCRYFCLFLPLGGVMQEKLNSFWTIAFVWMKILYKKRTACTKSIEWLKLKHDNRPLQEQNKLNNVLTFVQKQQTHPSWFPFPSSESKSKNKVR